MHTAGLLDTNATVMDPESRRTIVQSLILLRSKGCVDSLAMLPLLFRLFRCNDKALRKLVFQHIVADIRRLNRRHRNEKVNRSLQVRSMAASAGCVLPIVVVVVDASGRSHSFEFSELIDF